MKVSKLFFTLLVAGALAVIGCGDDGGRSASDVCNGCQNDLLRAACIEEYEDCVALNPNNSECEAGALAVCD